MLSFLCIIYAQFELLQGFRGIQRPPDEQPPSAKSVTRAEQDKTYAADIYLLPIPCISTAN